MPGAVKEFIDDWKNESYWELQRHLEEKHHQLGHVDDYERYATREHKALEKAHPQLDEIQLLKQYEKQHGLSTEQRPSVSQDPAQEKRKGMEMSL